MGNFDIRTLFEWRRGLGGPHSVASSEIVCNEYLGTPLWAGGIEIVVNTRESIS